MTFVRKPRVVVEKSSAADRGKTAEKAVLSWLQSLNTRVAQFMFLRLPDARSAMGRMKSMPCDFLVFSPAGATFVEVKELKHDFRIPADMITQLPELKKAQLAGCRALVLVNHTTTKLWRCIDASELEPRVSGSWDVSMFPTHATCEAAFLARYVL